ncbi:MAG: hypothetical protein RXQ22_09455 [Sulfolobus sp.]
MNESTLQHLEKAYALAYRAQKLIATDRTAYRIYNEIKEVIENLEFYLSNNYEYDDAELGNKLRMYEKQLKMIEENNNDLRRFFRQMGKPPSLPQNLGETEGEKE